MTLSVSQDDATPVGSPKKRRWLVAALGMAAVASLFAASSVLGRGDNRSDSANGLLVEGPSDAADTNGSETIGKQELSYQEDPADTASADEADGSEASAEPIDEAPSNQPDPQASPGSGCLNSSEPQCGPLEWTPTPTGNAPLVLSVPNEPLYASPGQQVAVDFLWADGDAVLESASVAVAGEVIIGTSCATTHRYGPWAIPSVAGAGSSTTDFIAPQVPGQYEVVLQADSSAPGFEGDCTAPYFSEAAISVSLTVQ